MMEVFKDIPGYEGLYQVSDLGRVRGKKGIKKTKFKRKQKTYIHVQLYKNNKKKDRAVHVLVALAFLDYTPRKGFVIDHINNDPSDNRLVNLQIITQRENCSKDKKGTVGVYFTSTTGRYRAKIRIGDNKIHLGYYDTEEEAGQAYQNKLKEIEYEKTDKVL